MDDCCCSSKWGIITAVKYSETAVEELTSKTEVRCTEELAQRDWVSRSPGRLMSERARMAPIEAILMAVARPIPEAAPVMRQVLPWNLVEDMVFLVCSFSLSSCCWRDGSIQVLLGGNAHRSMSIHRWCTRVGR